MGDWLRLHGSEVAFQVTGDRERSRPIGVSTLLERSHVAVLALDFGEITAIAKVFDARSDEARNACEREAFALMSMRGTALAPALHGYSQGAAYLVMEYVPGAALRETLDAENLVDYVRKVGAWSARYIAHQPKRRHDITWFDYMALYEGILDSRDEDALRTRFGKTPITAFGLAKHDLDPRNFIVAPGGRLVGIDFERTRFKPIGWDVIAAAWVLIKAFPGRKEDIVSGLVDGWTSVGAEHTPPELAEITSYFAERAAQRNWTRRSFKL